MIIRSEQMSAMEEKAGEGFVRRLTDHLRADYPEAVVRYGDEETTVSGLSDETLDRLVRNGIAKARHYGLTHESSISGFCAVMFEAAPNFDEYNLSGLCLNDENIPPDERLGEMLNVFNESHWEKIRSEYDPAGWEPPPEEETAEETPGGPAAAEGGADEGAGETPDLEATMLDSGKKPKGADAADEWQSGNTVFMPEKVGEAGDAGGGADELDKTIPNIDPTGKE